MHPTGDFPIVFSVIYQQLTEHVIRVNIEGDVISFNVDGNAVPECPFPLKVFFVEQRQFSKEGMDDADVIAMHLGLDKVTLNNYADQIGKAFYCTINSIQFKKEDGETNVYVDMQGTVPGIRFPLLSGSEQGRVLMELGIAVAQFLSRRMPVLLVIERNTFSFGDKLVKKYLDFFEVNEFNFQVILVSSEDDIKWHGWKVTEFQGERPNVKILQ